jgi:hypothetical protein
MTKFADELRTGTWMQNTIKQTLQTQIKEYPKLEEWLNIEMFAELKVFSIEIEFTIIFTAVHS